MKKENEEAAVAPKGIIYCRVSRTKRKIEGSGPESQEHRCRQYAELKGYEVQASRCGPSS